MCADHTVEMKSREVTTRNTLIEHRLTSSVMVLAGKLKNTVVLAILFLAGKTLFPYVLESICTKDINIIHQSAPQYH